ncbi:MAG TPA: PilZ domain-containing protein [Terriglobales bacterium]
MRLLRRIMGELEIAVEQCSDPDVAVQKLTRQWFEAMVIDCANSDAAFKILRTIRSAPANKRAIIVVLVENQSEAKGAFEFGAHFAILRSTTQERTKSTFRAVRALMKRERRRHARIPTQLAIEIRHANGSETLQSETIDLGENGMAIRADARKLPPSFRVQFALPGGGTDLNCAGEVAWKGNQVLGIRFRDLSEQASAVLKAWVADQFMDSDADDPPVKCTLTDLSLGGCYMRTESPFPAGTSLQLTMKVRDLEVRIEGIVRVMHPEAGMGVEFTQDTKAQRDGVSEFIQTLVGASGSVPSVEVRPGILDNSPDGRAREKTADGSEDALLSLFLTKMDLPLELFKAELHKQRTAPHPEMALTL